MYISVGKGEKTANTGSCRALVTYLEKENKEDKEQVYFFDQNRDQVLAEEVVPIMDKNIQKLGRSDAKYFMVTISPSQKELRHIENNTEQLRNYARAVMEEYAAAFNRGITGADLVYFGKIEQERKFTGADQAVQLGLVSAGSQKPGLNTHVHLIVSRKDKTQRLKLSPESNHRANQGNFQGGFDKIRFFMACEKAFDERFAYRRTQEEKFAYWKEMRNFRSNQQVSKQQIQQVRTAIAQAVQAKPTLLSFTKQLLKQNIRPVFEKDAAGQVVAMNYQLTSNQVAGQHGGKLVLTRDEEGKPILGVQRKREVGPKVAQRLMSPAEKDQLVSRGYTDYLTGFVSRLGKPFAARLYFNAQNMLKFSFTPSIPETVMPTPWTRQELKDFVFPGAYKGVPLTPAIKKQLLTNQVSEFIPRLVNKNAPAKAFPNLLSEKALGPGFDFQTLSQQMDAIQGPDLQQVERFLAPDRAIDPPKSLASKQEHTSHVENHTFNSFLQKVGHKLGFNQDEATDNRLSRLRKRRKKRIHLTI